MREAKKEVRETEERVRAKGRETKCVGERDK